MLYLSISEGKDGVHTTPIFATNDPAIIAAVAEALTRRLTREGVPPQLRSLRLGDSAGEEPASS